MAVYGIDLGTTYSCIAKVNDDGTVEVIRNQADQKTTLASAVYYEKDEGKVIVGDAAKEAMVDEPDRLCQFFKRYIGRPELLRKDREEEPDLYIVDGVERDPVELSALVLKKIVAYAKDQNEVVQDAVITCPAYFNQSQRKATEIAATEAGINVLGVIHEPTAAVMNYARLQGTAGVGKGLNVLVYDLGGGTFDISLVRLTNQENGKLTVQVLASVGDDVLGGKDWDRALEDLVERKLAENMGCAVEDISADVQFAIRAQVERQKQALTDKSSVTFRFTDDDGNRQKISVTREEFDEATSSLLNKTIPLVKSVLKNTTSAKPEEMSPDQIDVVLMVGGSTLMPQVKEALSKIFDEGKIILSDPHQAVAKGAAVVAKDLQSGETDKAALEKLIKDIEEGNVVIKDGKVIGADEGEEDKGSTALLERYARQKPTSEGEEGVIPSDTSTVIEVLRSKSEQQSSIELMDVSPTTFGIVLLCGFDENNNPLYEAVNLLMIGDQVPCDVPFGDGTTHHKEQEHLQVPLVTSRSHDKMIPVKRAADGKFYSDDASIELKTVQVLDVPLRTPHAERMQVIVHFTMDKLGKITLSAEMPDTGETNRIQVNFIEGYDEQKLDEMRQRTENVTFTDDYDL